MIAVPGAAQGKPSCPGLPAAGRLRQVLQDGVRQGASENGGMDHQLQLDAVPMGPSAEHNGNMTLDFKNGSSPGGFGHPSCKGGTNSDNIIVNLSRDYPTGPHSH